MYNYVSEELLVLQYQFGHWGGILLFTVHLTGSHWFIFFSKQCFKKICETSIRETLFMPALFSTKLCVGQPSKQMLLYEHTVIFQNYSAILCLLL